MASSGRGGAPKAQIHRGRQGDADGITEPRSRGEVATLNYPVGNPHRLHARLADACQKGLKLAGNASKVALELVASASRNSRCSRDNAGRASELERDPGSATLALRTLPLEHVRAVRAIHAAAAGHLAFNLVGQCAMICARNSSLTQAALLIRICVPDLGGLPNSVTEHRVILRHHDSTAPKENAAVCHCKSASFFDQRPRSDRGDDLAPPSASLR